MVFCIYSTSVSRNILFSGNLCSIHFLQGVRRTFFEEEREALWADIDDIVLSLNPVTDVIKVMQSSTHYSRKIQNKTIQRNFSN